MTNLSYKLVESSGRRTEGLIIATGGEAALATIAAGYIDGNKMIQAQRGRRGNLYALKVSGTTVLGTTGYSEITDNPPALLAGSGLPIRAVPFLAQSEGVGRAAAGNAALDAPDAGAAARCYLFDLSNDYGLAAEPSSHNGGIILSVYNDPGYASSPLTRLLSKLALEDPTHEYVGIPCAMGATSSADWASGIASPTTATLVGGAIRRVLLASRVFAAAGREFKVPFVWIGQATTNASTTPLAGQWDEDWSSIMTLLQSSWAGLYLGASLRAVAWNVPVTKPSGFAYAGADWTALRASINGWASSSRAIAQRGDGNLNGDNQHPNAAGAIIDADAAAAAAIAAGFLVAA